MHPSEVHARSAEQYRSTERAEAQVVRMRRASAGAWCRGLVDREVDAADDHQPEPVPHRLQRRAHGALHRRTINGRFRAAVGRLQVDRFLVAILRRALEYAKKNTKPRSIVCRARNKLAFTNLLEHKKIPADKICVDAYYEEIKWYLSEDDDVVDLGTEADILPFFAIEQDAKRIYATWSN